MLNQYEGKEHNFGGLQGLASLVDIRATKCILIHVAEWVYECIAEKRNTLVYRATIYM